MFQNRVYVSCFNNLIENKYLTPQQNSPLLSSQNLLHLPALGQLIHQLIQVPDLLRQRIRDILHPIPADNACDKARMRV